MAGNAILRAFKKKGYKIIIVTNQSGIARGYFTEDEFLKLTEKEIQILIELGNSKITSSKKHLLETVWKYNPDIKTSTVETHIHRLRKKLFLGIYIIFFNHRFYFFKLLSFY